MNVGRVLLDPPIDRRGGPPASAEAWAGQAGPPFSFAGQSCRPSAAGYARREIALARTLPIPASTSCSLDATSVTRHQTPLMIRHNQNAWTEVDAWNRCARFPPTGVGVLRTAAAVRQACPASRHDETKGSSPRGDHDPKRPPFRPHLSTLARPIVKGTSVFDVAPQHYHVGVQINSLSVRNFRAITQLE